MFSREEIEKMSLDEYIYLTNAANKELQPPVSEVEQDKAFNFNKNRSRKPKNNFQRNRFNKKRNCKNQPNYNLNRNKNIELQLFTRKNSPQIYPNTQDTPLKRGNGVQQDPNFRSSPREPVHIAVFSGNTGESYGFHQFPQVDEPNHSPEMNNNSELSQLAKSILFRIEAIQAKAKINKYDFKIQSDIATLQAKPLIVECTEMIPFGRDKMNSKPNFTVVTSDGAGVELEMLPQVTPTTMNQRFA